MPLTQEKDLKIGHWLVACYHCQAPKEDDRPLGYWPDSDEDGYRVFTAEADAKVFAQLWEKEILSRDAFNGGYFCRPVEITIEGKAYAGSYTAAN